ncbi:class I SAM-dependent methyltransferase [Portibacter marinus]|uniref:class I SAM-dependent methyltransferase n=1 Tax=Portibacter marinus TaxID=2898660 RepID=UPI001F3B5DE2|nr:class I SAM-dependent methyltransferase [Portibacter marinus]
MTKDDLAFYNAKIAGVVGSEEHFDKSFSNDVLDDYYTKSAFFYKKFHSPDGAMHLPIAFSEEATHKSKLKYQANAVGQMIKKNGYTHVLELGCGMGFNTIHLANQFPTVEFMAIDINDTNLTFARSKAKNINNASFQAGDFNFLEHFEGRYDLIFAVETLCYSRDFNDVIQSAAELLTENGRIVIFDGFKTPTRTAALNKIEEKAYQMFCWGFSLPDFKNYKDATMVENIAPLKLEESAEYSNHVMPNFLSFQKSAKLTLRWNFFLKLFTRMNWIPLAFIQQLSAGLMGPYFLEKRYVGYYKIVFHKEQIEK